MTQFVQRAGRLALALVAVGTLGLGSCKKDETTTVYGNWTGSSAFSGVARRGAVSFVIGNVAYVGTGIDGSGVRLRDFWSFNPATGSWNRMTPLPAAAAERYSAVAFVANGKGYVGTGLDPNNKYLADFWEYTPSASGGTWRQVASMPTNGTSTGRYGAVAASLNNVGYVGCGYDGNNEKDFYSFTPPTTATGPGVWAPLTNDFPGQKRINGVAFVVGSNMYVATGTNNGANANDVYAFNGTTWATKASLIAQTTGTTYDYSAVARTNAVAWTIGNYGYVATGSSRQDCYQYDAGSDVWTKMNPLVGSARNNAVAFGIGNYGYVGTGYSGSTVFDDFYQFDPSVVQQ